jgi:hypothetical protein
MQLLVVFMLCLVVSSTIYWLVANFWAWLLLIVGVVAVIRFTWPLVCAWLELRQVRAQTRRAMQRETAAYDDAQAQMEQIALQYHLRRGLGQ